MKAPAIGSVSFLVEDYVPERLDVTLGSATPVLRIGEEASISVDARFLYGAPGAKLAVGGEYTIQTSDSTGIAALDGYTVGLVDEPFEQVYNQLESGTETDEAGKAVIPVSLRMSLRPGRCRPPSTSMWARPAAVP